MSFINTEGLSYETVDVAEADGWAGKCSQLVENNTMTLLSAIFKVQQITKQYYYFFTLLS